MVRGLSEPEAINYFACNQALKRQAQVVQASCNMALLALFSEQMRA